MLFFRLLLLLLLFLLLEALFWALHTFSPKFFWNIRVLIINRYILVSFYHIISNFLIFFLLEVICWRFLFIWSCTNYFSVSLVKRYSLFHIIFFMIRPCLLVFLLVDWRLIIIGIFSSLFYWRYRRIVGFRSFHNFE
jgi:hypothetical protein